MLFPRILPFLSLSHTFILQRDILLLDFFFVGLLLTHILARSWWWARPATRRSTARGRRPPSPWSGRRAWARTWRSPPPRCTPPPPGSCACPGAAAAGTWWPCTCNRGANIFSQGEWNGVCSNFQHRAAGQILKISVVFFNKFQFYIHFYSRETRYGMIFNAWNIFNCTDFLGWIKSKIIFFY